MTKKGAAIRWSQSQLDAFQTKKRAVQAVAKEIVVAPDTPKATPLQRMQALGRLKTGEMNKTEAEYDDYLEGDERSDLILWRKFEGIKLRLADNTFYTPDFAVMRADGVIELHEVKGFWTDDARVKIKVAASLYPFVFIAVTKRAKKDGGGWKREEF